VIHWVSIPHAHPVTIYQYDRLFHDANPAREDDFMQFLNQNSLKITQGFAEPAIMSQPLHEVLQFERLGYYCVNEVIDKKASVFHRVVDLKDTWGKIS
jgi:glutaminyl-tRNA synthetase